MTHGAANLYSTLLAQGGANLQTSTVITIAIVVVAGILLIAIGFAVARYGKLWFQAYMSSADISLLSLVGMGFRQVRPTLIVTAKIMAAQAGLAIDTDDFSFLKGTKIYLGSRLVPYSELDVKSSDCRFYI